MSEPTILQEHLAASPVPGGHRFAVLLNNKAKKVTPEVRRQLAEVVPPDDLFYSRSFEEADEITRLLVRRRYPVVFTGGGDGTVIDFIDRITRAVDAMPDYACPHIGVLRLGTGNAIAQTVSSGNFICDIKSYIANGFTELHRLHLIEAEGRRFPFSGLGLDAEILNDFKFVKDSLSTNRVLGPVVQTVGGYVMAFLGRTAPRKIARMVKRQKTALRVTNLGERAYRLGAGGVVRAVLSQGDVLFDGLAGVAMIGTYAYYGYGLKVLPFAGLSPSFAHLRLIDISYIDTIRDIRNVWDGTWEHPNIRDFYVQHVLIEANEDVPFQIGGDAEGWRQSVEYKLSPACVDLVRFI